MEFPRSHRSHHPTFNESPRRTTRRSSTFNGPYPPYPGVERESGYVASEHPFRTPRRSTFNRPRSPFPDEGPEYVYAEPGRTAPRSSTFNRPRSPFPDEGPEYVYAEPGRPAYSARPEKTSSSAIRHSEQQQLMLDVLHGRLSRGLSPRLAAGKAMKLKAKNVGDSKDLQAQCKDALRSWLDREAQRLDSRRFTDKDYLAANLTLPGKIRVFDFYGKGKDLSIDSTTRSNNDSVLPALHDLYGGLIADMVSEHKEERGSSWD